MQIAAIVISFGLTIAALALLVPAVRKMLAVIRSGQPAPGRTDNPGARAVTMLKETFLHTRMLQWHWVGIMHWFVYMAFLLLSTAVLAAYFQLFKPDFAYPIVGHWIPFEWLMEVIGALSTIGIVFLIIYRQKHHPRREGRKSRFYGSTFWQAYFVEALALLEGAAILFVRAAEWKLDTEAGRIHYPFSSWLGDAIYPTSVVSLENLIYIIATFKIALAMIWLMVIARNITMGIAWHRFTAWFNIFYKRESDGSTALGAMKPLMSAGKPVTLDDIDDLDEDSVLGVGSVEDFSWKGLLDFTTCTECGRCQSQCPAWNTEKPLSPKLLIMGLRDHAYEKAGAKTAPGSGTSDTGDSAVAIAEKSLIGSRSDDDQWFYNPEGADFVIDEDVLWSCTSCGACVQQCPVDIEHVDHIMDMRRYQVLVESNFPAELNGLFKGLENKGNPWNMSSSARMDWAKGLDFEVPVVGEDLESLESVDWLFWVGCAGAYEDRAKKTTRAVAELLDMAGVSFGVLGNGETCTGDPARRAGNEFVFQGLAQQNIETFKEFKVKKVVSTCAHCFNTLKNEYKDLGIELEVVHHTQLLNRLVREGKLTPVKEGAGAAKRSITYHDPCFLGRHNQVYSPPRELLEILPGAEYVEMERNSEKSFCCGAGGARMWMEENIGERINLNRTKEAVGTGADQIAVGCPFCRVMLSDGLTAEQANGGAREEVEVLDVAQMLLASVKGESATKMPAGATAGKAKSAAPAAAAASTSSGSASAGSDVATKDEPEAGDVTVTDETVTDTADVGPAAKASGGSSLFDTPEPEAAKSEPSSGGSLFDTPAPEAPKAEPEAAPKAEAATEKPAADLGSGGSLFDLAGPAPAEQAEAEPVTTESKPEAEPEAAEPAAAAEPEATEPASSEASSAPATEIPEGGSLFDLAAPEPAPAAKAEPEAKAEAKVEPEPEPELTDVDSADEEPAAVDVQEEEAAPEAKSAGATSAPASSIPEGGSLFDIAAPEPAPAAAKAEAEPAPAAKAEPEAEAEPAPAAKAEPEAEPESEPEPEPEPESTKSEPASEGLSAGAALSQAATFAADDDSEPAAEAPEAKEEPEAEAEPEPAAEEETPEVNSEPDEEAETEAETDAETEAGTKPAAPSKPAGDAHTPKSDVDINESGSLFDI